MLSEYKEQLSSCHLEELCKKMNPLKVAGKLVNSGIFDQYDLEIVQSKITTLEKNSCILDTLVTRGFNGLSEFLKVLSSLDHTHLLLAELVQPVKYRIFWFAPTPTHAAAVVYVLEKYAQARFSKMWKQGKDKSLVVRRARVFVREYTEEDAEEFSKQAIDVTKMVKSSHEVEVCLVFPASGDITAALKVCFDEDMVSASDLVVMSGNSSSDGRLEEERVIVATEAMRGEESVSAGITGAKLASLETSLHQILSGSGDQQPVWLRQCNKPPHIEFLSLSDCTKDVSNSNTIHHLIPDFYKYCRDVCPGTKSLAFKGSSFSSSKTMRGLESRGTGVIPATCCIVMEVCNYYYRQQKA